MYYLNSLANVHVALLTDQDRVLNYLYRQNANDPTFLLPRIRSVVALPIALLGAISYEIQGALFAAILIVQLKPIEALDRFCHETVHAMRNLALIITGFAYAVLGLLCGAPIFQKFAPRDEEVDEEDPVDLKQEVAELRGKLNEAIAAKKAKKTGLKARLRGEAAGATELLEAANRNENPLQKQVEEKQGIIDRLQNQLIAAKAAKQAKKKALKAASKLIEENNGKMALIQKQVKNDEIVIGRLQRQLEEAEAIKKGVLLEREKDDKAYQESMKNLSDLRKILESMQSQLEKKEIEIKELKDQNLELQGVLVELRQRGENGSDKGSDNGLSDSIVFVDPDSFGSVLNGGTPQSPPSLLAKWGLVDGNPCYREERYVLALNQLKEIFAQELEKIIQLFPDAQEVAGYLDEALKSLNAKSCASSDRTDYNQNNYQKNFQKNVREALLAIQRFIEAEAVKPDEERVVRLNKLCQYWFTQLDFLKYYYETALFLASSGDIENKLFKDGTYVFTNQKLSDQLKELLNAIGKASYEVTKSRFSFIEKIQRVSTDFDPLAHNNIPSVLMELVYELKEGLVNQPPLKIKHIRTGVPIGPAPKGALVQPWMAEGVSIVPEFIAFLRSLKHQKQKISITLHLNPHYFDVKTGKRKPGGYVGENLLPAREGLWIQLLVALSKCEEFKDVVFLSLIPMDGDVEHLIRDERPQTKSSFIDSLRALIENENGPFIFPKSLVPDRKAFAEELLNEVSGRYFHHLDIFNKVEKEAFYGFFASLAIEKICLMGRASIVQRFCVDAIDRTAALVGADKTLKLSSLDKSEENPLGQLEKKENQQKILGTILGLAPAVDHRPILKPRADLAVSAVIHLENLKKYIEENIARQKEKEKTGIEDEDAEADYFKPYIVQGYVLKKMIMGELN